MSLILMQWSLLCETTISSTLRSKTLASIASWNSDVFINNATIIELCTFLEGILQKSWLWLYSSILLINPNLKWYTFLMPASVWTWFAPNCVETIPVPMTLGWQWRIPGVSCTQWHRRNKFHTVWQQAQGQNKQVPYEMDGNKRGSSEWMNK